MTQLRKAPHLAEMSRGDVTYVMMLARVEEVQVPVVLEGSAHVIWQCLDGVVTVDDVVQALMTGDNAVDARIAADVPAFVESLRQRGLLE